MCKRRFQHPTDAVAGGNHGLISKILLLLKNAQPRFLLLLLLLLRVLHLFKDNDIFTELHDFPRTIDRRTSSSSSLAHLHSTLPTRGQWLCVARVAQTISQRLLLLLHTLALKDGGADLYPPSTVTFADDRISPLG